MLTTTIYVTDADKERLQKRMDEYRQSNPNCADSVRALERELKRAHIVTAADIPASVVTMNSRAVLRNRQSGRETVYTLVYPEDASLASGKVSVLAPVGLAILGYGKGDVISWPVPSGVAELEVVDVVYQPEAVGDFHL